MSRGREWTEDEVEYVIKHYGKTPSKEIGEYLGRSRENVNSKAYKLGLTRQNKKWDDSDDEFIQDNMDKGYDWIAEQLGVTRVSLLKHIRFVKTRKERDRKRKNNNFQKSKEDYLDLCDISYLTGVPKSDIDNWENLGLSMFLINGKKYASENHLIGFMRKNPDVWLCRHCEEWFFWKYKWFREKAKKEQQEYLKWKWGIEA